LPRYHTGEKDSDEIKKFKRDLLDGKIKLREKDFQKIAEVETWFWEQIRNCDALVIINKKEKEGEIGVNTAMDIEVALASKKPVILIYPPTDIGIEALWKGGIIKVIDHSKLLEYLKQLS